MPKYIPSDDEMDESYGAETAPVTPPEEAAPAEESVDEENAGMSEILVEKAKLPPGTKEGDTVTFKVKKDFGDEISLEVTSAPEQTTAEELGGEEAGELAALAGEEM